MVRRLLPALLALFIILPLIDIVFLVVLGGRIGFLITVAVVIITGVIGAFLAKAQGLLVWRQIQADIAAGRVPAQGLIDGALILVAGGILMTPGFITDLLGLALLVPPVRGTIKRLARRATEGFVTRRYGL
jgi:UPF0716 protein FxsA